MPTYSKYLSDLPGLSDNVTQKMANEKKESYFDYSKRLTYIFRHITYVFCIP